MGVTIMKKIGVEEHFSTEATLKYFRPPSPVSLQDTGGEVRPMNIGETLSNTTERLKDMEEAGIDMQLLSLGPGIEQYDPAFATSLARDTNDELSEVVRKYPDKFGGLATMAPQDPEAAADELERAVVKLASHGDMIKSHIE